MLARWRTARVRAHPGCMNERICSWGGLANHRDNSLQLFCVALRVKLLGTKTDGLILSEAVARSRGLWTRGSPNDQYCFFVGTSRIHQAGI